MDEQNISPEESLQIITGMIGKAKSNFARGGSFYFLLWGSVIALADFGHFGQNNIKKKVKLKIQHKREKWN